MMAADVFAGANIACIELASYPGRPDDATVGIPGASAEGSAVVTAIARSLPDLSGPATEPRLANMTCVSPAITEMTAGPAPLNGMRTMLTPAICLKSSTARCVGAPVDPD